MYIPKQTEQLPFRGNAFSRWLGRSLLRMLGWRFEGELPNTRKCLVIIAPHTSNWDFIIAMMAMLAVGLKANWMGKDSIFIWPLSMLFVWAGGIPTVRDKSAGTVAQQIKIFQERDQLVLGIAPEGTRSDTRSWKNGFYHIANGANVPFFPIYLDFDKKVVGMLPLYHPTGEKEADITALMDLFKHVRGKVPKNASWQDV